MTDDYFKVKHDFKNFNITVFIQLHNYSHFNFKQQTLILNSYTYRNHFSMKQIFMQIHSTFLCSLGLFNIQRTAVSHGPLDELEGRG